MSKTAPGRSPAGRIPDLLLAQRQKTSARERSCTGGTPISRSRRFSHNLSHQDESNQDHCTQNREDTSADASHTDCLPTAQETGRSLDRSLGRYGWNKNWAEAFAKRNVVSPPASAGRTAAVALPGRVLRADGASALVITSRGSLRAGSNTSVSRQAGLTAPPVTGDWVTLLHDPNSGTNVTGILPRQSTLVRQGAGQATGAHTLAANMDFVVITQALDRTLSLQRITRIVVRMLVAGWESGATPVVVLTKADLCSDAEETAHALAAECPGVEVIVTSSETGEGLDRLSALACNDRTLALLGASGAGKSTLVNALAGTEVQTTGNVRVGDAKGRHTTTARSLVLLPESGVLLDTPGLRSLGLWSGEEGMTKTFSDIESLAVECRFADCRHETEPGCAVQAGIGGGEISPARAESWRKLQKELAYQEKRKNVRERREEDRRFTKLYKSIQSTNKKKR